VIVALAGRRIDVADAEVERFPLRNLAAVRSRLLQLLIDGQVDTLVCAAACGADLLALDAATELGLRCRIVLPFSTTRFRESSVIDRPGPWGAMFDRIVAAVEAAGDLVTLGSDEHPEAAYATNNRAILDEALAVAARADGPAASVLAVIVWDQASRGPSDMTEDFGREASARGLTVLDVSTL
jgi:hypothetical protein